MVKHQNKGLKIPRCLATCRFDSDPRYQVKTRTLWLSRNWIAPLFFSCMAFLSRTCPAFLFSPIKKPRIICHKKGGWFTPAPVALIIPYIYPDLSIIISFPYQPIKDHFVISLADTDNTTSAHLKSAWRNPGSPAGFVFWHTIERVAFGNAIPNFDALPYLRRQVLEDDV